MHDTAFATGSKFLESYASKGEPTIVELGSYDYNGSLRKSCPRNARYVGLDVMQGPGVDLIIEPSKKLPLQDGYADFVISTSQMEHDPRFWVTFLELCRITKDGGAIFLNVPSNGIYHSYPVDVWRFYPDAGKALADWACDNGYQVRLWESFTCARQNDYWNDFFAVFHKGNRNIEPSFLHQNFVCWNIWKFGANEIGQIMAPTEDRMIAENLKAELLATRIELKNALEKLNTANVSL